MSLDEESKKPFPNPRKMGISFALFNFNALKTLKQLYRNVLNTQLNGLFSAID